MISSATSSTNKTTFFDLPAELRNAIYAEAIDSCPKGTITLKSGTLPRTGKTSESPQRQDSYVLALLLTSHQTHTETLPMLLATHKIRIADTAWPRIHSMRPTRLESIRHLILSKPTTRFLSSALDHASTLPSLRILDIRIANFRFGKVKPFLLKGFPSLEKLYVSDPKLRDMAEHFALEDGEQPLPVVSCCVYAVEDFQAWRKKTSTQCWRKLDAELKEEVQERMAKLVTMEMF